VQRSWSEILHAKFPLGREDPRTLSISPYNCTTATWIQTIDRKINDNRKHALFGPTLVKESMCWVLNAYNGNNERYGNASRVRVGNGWGHGPYIVDGRLVVWWEIQHILGTEIFEGSLPIVRGPLL
jgi:hypothetical protein